LDKGDAPTSPIPNREVPVCQDADSVRSIQALLGEDLDRLAHEHGLDQRAGKLSGGAFARTLILSFLRNPDATLDQIAQTAAVAAQPVSPQAIHQRFTWAAAEYLRDCLGVAVAKALPTTRTTVPLLGRFTRVCVLDSTTIPLPDALAPEYRGSRGASAGMKVQVRFELTGGGVDAIRLEDARAADVVTAVQTADLTPGSLHLRDLGYFDRSVFRTIAGAGAYFLTRFRQPSAVFDASGERVANVAEWLDRAGTGVVDTRIELGTAERLACRLIAIRVSDEVRAVRRKALRRQGTIKKYRPSAARVGLCGWNVFVTNVPAERLSPAEAHALIRLRWQVELLFKGWKSDGRVAVSRSSRPARILCEVYAKLLAALLGHRLVVHSCWGHANRSVRRATAAVRAFAGAIAAVWRNPEELGVTLGRITRMLERTARVQRRRKRPAAFQLLDNPNDCGYKATA
jgi:hypothetical protein